MIVALATLVCPVQQLHGAVDRGAFLVAGDQEADRAFWWPVCREIGQRRGGKGRDSALHVLRAASVENAVDDVRREGIVPPCRYVARRHHVRMARKQQVGRAGAEACVEIVDIRRSRIYECHAVGRKTIGLEEALQ